MIEVLYKHPYAIRRQREAPLLKEREQYLLHLLNQGTSKDHVKHVAARQLIAIRLLNLTKLRKVSVDEIKDAVENWEANAKSIGKKPINKNTAISVACETRNWLAFHKVLIKPLVSVGHFRSAYDKFVHHITVTQQLASATTANYGKHAASFLIWISNRHSQFMDISLRDVDDYIEYKRRAGWKLRTIVTGCQSLRAFFLYTEQQGWNGSRIALGIQSPSLPRNTTVPRGPKWKDVKRLLKTKPMDARARAIIFLCAVYGLRSSEVANLTLDDFDWVNETFTVRRAKRGRVQQYPIQWEVGEAILNYLRKDRPPCKSRLIFLSKTPPYRILVPTTLYHIVADEIKLLSIETKNKGPHSLRHACATQLLARGSSLNEIADFLGHRNLASVTIYAKFDTRSLRKVAAFSLAGVK